MSPPRKRDPVSRRRAATRVAAQSERSAAASWMPAFAGMTTRRGLLCHPRERGGPASRRRQPARYAVREVSGGFLGTRVRGHDNRARAPMSPPRKRGSSELPQSSDTSRCAGGEVSGAASWMPAFAGMTTWRVLLCHPRESGGPASRCRQPSRCAVGELSGGFLGCPRSRT